MTSTCTCQVRHAVTEQHRDALLKAMSAALDLGQEALAEHYAYRLEPCPTATEATPNTDGSAS